MNQPAADATVAWPPPRAESEAPAALRQGRCSLSQWRVWVLHQLDPADPTLTVAARWQLAGTASPAEWTARWQSLAARHDSLRTQFAVHDGEPVRIILPHVTIDVATADLTGLPEPQARAQAERLAEDAARLPFDLAAAPLIRVACLRMAGAALLLVTAHRMICDEASLDILAREMDALGRQSPTLAHLPVSYSDFVHDQSERLASAEFAQAEAEWRQALHGLAHFRLAPDRFARPGRQSTAAILSTALPGSVLADAAGLAQRTGTTLFVALLAAWLTTLHRQTGETEIDVSTPLPGRGDGAFDGVVGPFVNPVLLRADLAGDPTADALLARLGALVTTTLARGALPMERLVDFVNPKRDRSRKALASVNFSLRRPAPGADGGLTPLDSCPAAAAYDLDFSIAEAPGGWRATCVYDAALFLPATISGLLQRFLMVLHAMAADASQAISAIPILTPEERQALTADCHRTQADYPSTMTAASLFAAQAARTPGAIALVCDGATLTYRDLDRASNRLARALQRQGWAPGARIGLLLDRSPELVVALLGILKSGSAYVPLDPNYPPARLAHIAESAQFAGLVTRRALAGRLAASSTPLLLMDDLAQDDDHAAPGPELAPGHEPAPADVAYVIYTSGSTGKPKGVQIQHAALVNLLWSMRARPGLSAADTLVAVTTISFDIAALEIFLPLITGARLVVATEAQTMDGGALLALLQTEAATVMQATPATWRLLIEAGWDGDPHLTMLCGGEALPRPLADALQARGRALWNMYGPTETTIWSSALLVEPGEGPVPIGAPIANTQFYVVDRHLALAPPGAPGELCIGGDGLALGYFGLPAMTQDRFVPDPFGAAPGGRLYRTGDLVRLQPSGLFDYLGRIDHQIKLRGFRIELGEIEAVLLRHPGVAEAVATIDANPPGEPVLRAYIVPSAHARGTEASLVSALRASLAEFLPAYMHPAYLGTLAALPRTPNGKIDRQALPAHAAKAPPGQQRKLTETERRIALIWADVLGRDDFGASANFFELGGHSLLAARMLPRVEAQFKRRIGLAALFEAPILAEFARLVENADLRAFDFRQVVRLQPGGALTPLIAINNTGIFFPLVKRLGAGQPFTALQTFDPAHPEAREQSFEQIAAGYVRLIRKLHPAGPYALIGWCNAGALAFEIGRQLYQLHPQPPLVVMVDTWAPGAWRRLPKFRAALAACSWGALRASSGLGGMLANYASWPGRLGKLRVDAGQLLLGRQGWRNFLTRHQFFKTILWSLRTRFDPTQASVAPTEYSAAEAYDDWLTRYLDTAAWNFQPQRYPAHVLLLRAGQEPSSRWLDDAMGWSGLVAGKLDVFAVPGDHFTMFQEPGVGAMADRVAQALRSHAGRAAAGTAP